MDLRDYLDEMGLLSKRHRLYIVGWAEMSSLWFWGDVFCLFKARVLRKGHATSPPEILEKLWKCTPRLIIRPYPQIGKKIESETSVSDPDPYKNLTPRSGLVFMGPHLRFWAGSGSAWDVCGSETLSKIQSDDIICVVIYSCLCKYCWRHFHSLVFKALLTGQSISQKKF
jgi:hypothetical protein